MRIPDNIDFAKYLADMSVLEAQEIHWGSTWRDELIDRAKHGKEITGDKLPWGKTWNCFRMRPGELTIWAGYSGHRKSMMLGQVMVELAQETRVCIASLEMQPVETLDRMCRQAATCHPAPDFAGEFGDWSYERICIYDQLDTVDALRILGVVHYASHELGCKHIVIDSLSKCGFADDDYSAEKKFVDRLQWAAKRYGVHIHLVCHMRKGFNEYKVPEKADIKGTGGITDMADNVAIVWKDKIKEKAKQKRMANAVLSDDEEKSLERPDQVLKIEKQRHGDWEGGFMLWFDEPSLQFLHTESAKPQWINIEKAKSFIPTDDYMGETA